MSWVPGYFFFTAMNLKGLVFVLIQLLENINLDENSDACFQFVFQHSYIFKNGFVLSGSHNCFCVRKILCLPIILSLIFIFCCFKVTNISHFLLMKAVFNDVFIIEWWKLNQLLQLKTDLNFILYFAWSLWLNT